MNIMIKKRNCIGTGTEQVSLPRSIRNNSVLISLVKEYIRTQPVSSLQLDRVDTGQLIRMCHRIKIGDTVPFSKIPGDYGIAHLQVIGIKLDGLTLGKAHCQ